MHPKIVRFAIYIQKNLTVPRGNLECPFEDKDGFENLILLCKNHHDEIDDRVREYPPDRVIRMKNEHESAVATRMKLSEIDFNLVQSFPFELIDEIIDAKIEYIRKSLPFQEFERVKEIENLGIELQNNGKLSLGTKECRASALAKCSIYLPFIGNDELRQKFYDSARTFTPKIIIVKLHWLSSI